MQFIEKTFSRKYNTERHNSKVHEEFELICNKEI